jgi:hypothetical protein
MHVDARGGRPAHGQEGAITRSSAVRRRIGDALAYTSTSVVTILTRLHGLMHRVLNEEPDREAVLVSGAGRRAAEPAHGRPRELRSCGGGGG